MFSFFKDAKTAEEENVRMDPVKTSEIEDMIKLIQAADNVKAYFALDLHIGIDHFKVSSENYDEIKLLKKSASNKARLMIRSHDCLLSTTTEIEIENIFHIELKVLFYDENSINVCS